MRASYYDQQGPAAEVLRVGELPDPEPGPGEVRVRVRFSGVNPGDTKKRAGYFGSAMPYPRVIPHSDGVGVIDALGTGVPAERLGERVWIYGAQSYRPFGTAAQFTVVPNDLAVGLPESVDERLAACLGIAGITAHRAVFADGPVDGRTVLVHGALGAVGSLAAQLAHWAGAEVIATVRRSSDREQLRGPLAAQVVSLESADAAEQVRRFAPDGVDRIIEVSFSDNVALDAKVAANDAVIAAYATRDPRPSFDFWPMLFDNLTIRLLGSDDFPVDAKRNAAVDLTRAAAEGALTVGMGEAFPLAKVADAHDQVDRDNRRRVLIAVDD